MMTYHDEKRGWRVVIEGASLRPLRELYLPSNWLALVKEWQFTDYQGRDVPLTVTEPGTDGQDATYINVDGLTQRQVDWLREKIRQAARDEELDPEASRR